MFSCSVTKPRGKDVLTDLGEAGGVSNTFCSAFTHSRECLSRDQMLVRGLSAAHRTRGKDFGQDLINLQQQ